MYIYKNTHTSTCFLPVLEAEALIVTNWDVLNWGFLVENEKGRWVVRPLVLKQVGFVLEVYKWWVLHRNWVEAIAVKACLSCHSTIYVCVCICEDAEWKFWEGIMSCTFVVCKLWLKTVC